VKLKVGWTEAYPYILEGGYDVMELELSENDYYFFCAVFSDFDEVQRRIGEYRESQK